MNLGEAFHIALRSLQANKLRSLLTMLGIIIGVGAVITLMSAGSAVEVYVTDQFRSIGSNLLFIASGNFETNQGPNSETAGVQALTNGDVAALRDPVLAPDVAAIAPELSGGATVTFERESELLSVSGVTPIYDEIRGSSAEVEIGRFIEESDQVAASRVAVLGSEVVEELFPENAFPIDETIRIDDVAFKVVGVMKEQGGSGFGSEDGVVFVPLATAQNRLFAARSEDGDFRVSLIYAQAVGEDRTDEASNQIRQLLRQRHNIQPADDDDFTIINQADILASASSVLAALTVFLGAIAAISLLVGGIGIMNIMLVSVTERTREIGLRKAVGARRRDILLQFLVESVVLAVSGGAFGILLGFAGSRAIGLIEPALDPSLSVNSVALATGFSAAVGLFFGIYPATRASRLDPIDALRYE